MARHHGSQCGFCTPGIVMSLFTLFHSQNTAPTKADVNEWLAGNLCRCTGYRPIVDAAIDALSGPRIDRFTEDQAQTIETLTALSETGDLLCESGSGFFAAPGTVEGLADLYLQHPDATLVAGATDVGLWITKALRALPKIIWIGQLKGLKDVTETMEGLTIGAACTYSDAESALRSLDPGPRRTMAGASGSKQVRSSGTVGGNIANGSPIGDTPPALIALGAHMGLRRGDQIREVAVEDFFLEYGKQDRRDSEFVSAIKIPKPAPGRIFRCYKISKRFDQDISSVMGAFSFSFMDGRLTAPDRGVWRYGRCSQALASRRSGAGKGGSG